LERNKLDEPPIANYRLAVAAISTWLEAIGNCRCVTRSLPGDAYFDLRYEQLAGDPARYLAALCDFVGEDQMADLNLLTWLTAYLDECGRNGGKPLVGPDLDRFLPWNASPGDFRTWAPPPPSPG
jgi:hypothetical protein